jgi:hypothetical protein
MMSYSEFVASRVKWLPTVQLDLLHAAIGMAGEVHELRCACSREHQLEELGDFRFYLEHYRQAVAKADVPEVTNPFGNYYFRTGTGFVGLIDALESGAHCALDLAKKGYIYNKPLHEMHLPEVGVLLLEALGSVAAAYGVSLIDLEHRNQAKLLKRYPKGYSDADAQARADKKEGEV